jgi:hypothetical protein
MDGSGGGAERSYGGMFDLPFWFEMAHAEWPEAGFDYFLAQLRGPREDQYYPSLFFGLRPIDPAKVRPPPAPSRVFPQRGLALLRADESPAYWTGAAPAVAMRLATPYAHHVQDSFSLCGLYAFHRPVYVNHVHSTNYTGVDPGWSNSMRAHMGVIVDCATPRTVGEAPVRHHFCAQAKFLAVRAAGVYEGVDQTRALVLTREYLLDVFDLKSDRPRYYLWLAHTFGRACPDEPERWAPSTDLRGPMPDLAGEMSRATAGDWAVTATQYTLGAHPDYGGLGGKFFERRVGVRMTMLGEPGTVAYTAWTPVLADFRGHWMARERFAYGAVEPAGVTFAASRRGPRARFIALHEPFENTHRIAGVRLIQQNESAAGVAVAGAPGSGIDDRILVALGDGSGQAATLEGDGEAFAFAGYAMVRVADGQVNVAGSLSSMRLRCGPVQPRLFVNGRETPAVWTGGVLSLGDAGNAPETPPVERPRSAARIAAFWQPETAVRLPAHGAATATLTLRNIGREPAAETVRLAVDGGVVCDRTEGLRRRRGAGPRRDVPASDACPARAGRRPIGRRAARRQRRDRGAAGGVEGGRRRLLRARDARPGRVARDPVRAALPGPLLLHGQRRGGPVARPTRPAPHAVLRHDLPDGRHRSP